MLQPRVFEVGDLWVLWAVALLNLERREKLIPVCLQVVFEVNEVLEVVFQPRVFEARDPWVVVALIDPLLIKVKIKMMMMILKTNLWKRERMAKLNPIWPQVLFEVNEE